MKSYGQFCPVSKASEVIGERWTLLVLRELLLGSKRFNDIHRGVALMSPALLSQRLRMLQGTGVIVRMPGTKPGTYEYQLTPAGIELRPLIEMLGAWGQRWVRSQYIDAEMDVSLLMWDIRRFVHPGGFGESRVVVQFDLADQPGAKRWWWLVCDRGEVELCLIDPGFEVDLRVVVAASSLARLWMGDSQAAAEVRAGRLQLDGPAHLVRLFPAWLGQNPMAQIGPAATADLARA